MEEEEGVGVVVMIEWPSPPRRDEDLGSFL